jgi:hypothetical protein
MTIADGHARLPGMTTAALTSIGAGVVHAGAIGSHADHPELARLFVTVACFQLGWGVVALRRPSRWLALVGAIGNLVAVGGWLTTRLTGLSFIDGLELRETAQFADASCALFGLVAAGLAAFAFLIGWRTANRAQLWLPSLLVAGLAIPALVTGSDPVQGQSSVATASAEAATTEHIHEDTSVVASSAAVIPLDVSATEDHTHTAAALAQPTAPTAEAPHVHETAPVVVDDKGLSLIMNGHQHEHVVQPMDSPTTAMLAHQLARTAELVALYPTIAAAEAAGYRRQGPYSPGLGTHYGKGGGTLVGATITDDNVLNPMLIFDGTDQDSKLAGFMYIAFGTAGVPEGFAGPNDIWHYHTNICIVSNPDGSVDTPLGADKENVPKELCDSYGGFLLANSGYMLHVWTVPGYESAKGVFNEVNPALACADGTYYTKPIEELGTSLSLCADA